MFNPLSRPLSTTFTPYHPIAIAIPLLALVIGSAYVSVPLVYSPVPMTLQTLAVLMVGIWAGPRVAAGVLAAYLALGIGGFPVFAGGQPALGTAFFARPTAGFLLAFLPAAVIAGWIATQFASRALGALAAMIAGHALIFVGGVGWLAAFMGFEKAVALGLMPFLLGTLVKCAIGVALASVIPPWRGQRR
ncbi:MAG TPA: biotin transporter BioY [Xanthobacteraceae bacterium]|nr:biotin transporter BioY [Xanthobacteraceae bacterium]